MADENELTYLTISTHTPNKWRMLDMETGEVWRKVNDVWELDETTGKREALLIAALISIRDATHKNALMLRAEAALALDSL